MRVVLEWEYNPAENQVRGVIRALRDYRLIGVITYAAPDGVGPVEWWTTDKEGVKVHHLSRSTHNFYRALERL